MNLIPLLAVAPGGCASLPLGSSIIARIPTADATSSFSCALAQSPPVDLPVKGVRSTLDNTDHVFTLPNNLSCYKVFELAKAVSGKSTPVLQVDLPVWVWTSAMTPVAEAIAAAGQVIRPSSFKYSKHSGTG